MRSIRRLLVLHLWFFLPDARKEASEAALCFISTAGLPVDILLNAHPAPPSRDVEHSHGQSAPRVPRVVGHELFWIKMQFFESAACSALGVSIIGRCSCFGVPV